MPRLLHARSQHGYTSAVAEALPLEPEAVPSDYQRELTARSHRTAKQRDRDAVRAASDRIADELDTLGALVSDRRVASHVRAMRRQLSQLVQLSDRHP